MSWPSEPETASRLRLVIAGRLTGEEARVLGQPDLAPVVQVLGALDRPTAVALQRRADALLLVTSNHRSIVTGKLFEYLTAGKPILTLAGDNEAGSDRARDRSRRCRRARRRRRGSSRRWAEPPSRSLTYAPHGLEQFTYEAAAEVLHGRIEDAISRAQARLGGQMTTGRQSDIDASNAEFWSELCGSSLARAIGVNDASAESLARFDRAYLDLYPYLERYLPVAGRASGCSRSGSAMAPSAACWSGAALTTTASILRRAQSR